MPGGDTSRRRVCFRFWQSKGLLERVKGRYRIVGTPEEFAKRAGRAWEEVSEAGADASTPAHDGAAPVVGYQPEHALRHPSLVPLTAAPVGRAVRPARER